MKSWLISQKPMYEVKTPKLYVLEFLHKINTLFLTAKQLR